ncbi:MAG: DUF1349 domain-containing protein [bacterium]
MPNTAWAQDPTVDVWYGLDQSFGQVGTPQNWVNILGNVADPDGIESLTYTINGSPDSVLSVGPDFRRLAEDGDFNIDLAITDLLSGANTIEITATDSLGFDTTETVNLDYTPGTVWPLPYTIDWDTVTAVTNVVQVVDGQWDLVSGGARSTQVDYDRIIAIGDTTWDDYEITVPVTFNGTEPTGPYSGNARFWIFSRWTGHTDQPANVAGWQPKSGWIPTGAACWYDFAVDELSLDGIDDPLVDINIGDTYYWKFRVESTPGQGGLYSLKVWPDGEPEPAFWNLTRQRGSSDEPNGSLIIIGHHVDITVGDITVTEIPLTLSDVHATATSPTTATVSWTTDNPSSSRVDFGLTAAYGDSVLDGALVTSHSLELTGLTPDTTYHYLVTSVDGSSNTTSSLDLTFTTTISNLVSDDFNTCTLDTNLWTFVDPLTDATMYMTGQQATISLSGGVTHDLWGTVAVPFVYDTPRIMQPANDADFEIEVKFESALDQTFQMQGVIIEEDSTNLLRLEFLHNLNTRVFAAKFVDGIATTIGSSLSIASSGTEPLYLRVRRQADQWTMWYSFDGSEWLQYVSFSHSMTVTAVGVHMGNVGSPAPAHTASIDYFFNTASPIIPEDAIDLQPPQLATIGNQYVDEGGSLTVNVTATDANGDPISLTTSTLPGFATFTDYGNGTGDLDLDPLTGDEGEYQITVTATDSCGLYDWETFTLSVGTGVPSTIVSDDFNSCTLDTDIWTFYDPIGDAELALDGNLVSIDLPYASEHNMWGTGPGDFENNTARIMQSANDVNFEIEMKFESALTQTYQQQGLVVEQDVNDMVRVEFHHNIGTRLFAATIVDGDGTAIINEIVEPSGVEPLYLRLRREGDDWTVSYSTNGSDWNSYSPFTHAMTVVSVGAQIGNVGNPAPAHTALIDYFFNTASPVIPEDPDPMVAPVLASIGNQSLFEGESLSVLVSATDLNSDDITLEATNLPGFASFTDYGNGTGSLDLDPLSGDSGDYDITVTATDPCALFDDETFTVSVNGMLPSIIVSDDFNSCELNETLWIRSDPLGDCSHLLSGTQLLLTVPSGVAHELSGTGPGDFVNNQHRIMQAVNNVNFEIEAGFESGVSEMFQRQGFLLEEDADDLLNVELVTHGTNQTTIALTRSVAGLVESITGPDSVIAGSGVEPIALRLTRSGNDWTVAYSTDGGGSWPVYHNFSHTLAVTSVGVHAGNSGGSAPAHTAVVDYFFNNASVINPEDPLPCDLPVTAITDLAMTSLLNGGDSDGSFHLELAWSPLACAATVELYRHGFGAYPEYDDGGGEIPAAPATPGTGGWELVASLPATANSYTDDPPTRDYWYYVAFVTDGCGNVSVVSNRAGGVLNYFLGDVSNGSTPGTGNNTVSNEDLLLLSGNYGTVLLPDDSVNYLDVGPTTTPDPASLPQTDDRVDFEDMMIFALNFDLPGGLPDPPAPVANNELALNIPPPPAVGQTFEATVTFTGDGHVQGLSIPVTWNPARVEFVNFAPGALLTAQGGTSLVLMGELGIFDIGLMGVRALGISGEGILATITFRYVSAGARSMNLGEVTARDQSNQDVILNRVAVTDVPDSDVAIRVTQLYPNAPNPFNPRTRISFDLAQSERVSLKIYSIDGRLVDTLVDSSLPAGRYAEFWSGTDSAGRRVASGTYLVHLVTPSKTQTRRMMLLK